MSSNIHPTAVVAKSARIPHDVEIGPYSVIGEKVQIGAGSKIGPHVVLYPYTTMGENCRVHAGAVVGDTPQDLSFKETESFVKIGDRCVIRENVTIHRGTKESTSTVMGDDCYLMANSHLAHNVKLGNKVILANGVLLAGYVEVGDGVFMGGNAAIHQFCHIGRLVMVGGLSAISKDVPPFFMTSSGAYNEIAGLNVVGMRRSGLSPQDRSAVKKAFQLLYRSGLNISQALEKIKSDLPVPPALEICQFVEQSKRGICQASVAPVEIEDG